MHVFVTVGTTQFPQLVEAVLSTEVTSLLSTMGYTSLTLQVGRTKVPTLPSSEGGILIKVFDYKPSLRQDMEESDLVISHAGAGTCLEVLELNKPLVVIVNDQLMDNHQTELADRLASSGHLVSGTVSSLMESLVKMEKEKEGLKTFLPGDGRLFSRFINDLMGV